VHNQSTSGVTLGIDAVARAARPVLTQDRDWFSIAVVSGDDGDAIAWQKPKRVLYISVGRMGDAGAMAER
jgi:hypothetical protein